MVSKSALNFQIGIRLGIRNRDSVVNLKSSVDEKNEIDVCFKIANRNLFTNLKSKSD